MLQVKNLVKRYETKGEVVTALNKVSVDFPETGMVFLLGKSGSGKSTLLNVSGGLDSPDEGEIIVKGKSSRDFTPSDFDSYRNTYVGFIFQEYNVLNEFTVKENVALALELQGKPRDEKLIQEILEQVDMAELGDRRPNTLSGGQKQRAAIARALVKNPEIIMADEPTGALDSATGKQVFDTLKKLSANKLVVVVSHDREFAETYADRIIELKDGSIVSDVSRGTGSSERTNLSALSEKKLAVDCGAALTDEEIEKVCLFLKNGKGKFVISAEEEDVKEIHAEQSGGFSETKETHARIYEKDESSFIKSKFPLRHAIKMGFSGLKFKPVRLAFTILLSTVAFMVFGVFSTLMTYNEGKIAAKELISSEYSAAFLQKKGIFHMKNGGSEYTVSVTTGRNGGHYSQSEIENITREYDFMNFFPAYDFNILTGLMFSGTAQWRSAENEHYASSYYYSQISTFTAFADISYVKEKSIVELVAGEYPAERNEGMISVSVFETFRQFGYAENEGMPPRTEKISSYEDLIGKEIPVRAGEEGRIRIKVTGIFDPHEDFTAFQNLKSNESVAVMKDLKSVQDDFKDAYRYSLSSIAFVADGFHDLYKAFDSAPYTAESLKENYALRYNGNFGMPKFVSSSYEEEDGAYCQYLISSLSENRSKKSNTLLRSLNDMTDEETDTVYFAPYGYIKEIAKGQNIMQDVYAILGSSAGILAVFSALLLFNFISASIHAKKKDIGILRAVGARGVDVFKIFFVEALVLAILCFALGCIGSVVACSIANRVMIAQEVLAFDFFLFDGLNVLIVLAISLVTAFLATLVPVWMTVKKKPVEAIRSI